MTEKINRVAKERHAADMAAYEGRKFEFEYIRAATNQRKKKTVNVKLDFIIE
jgi:hypothetical protein